jgi:hypothetical protein
MATTVRPYTPKPDETFDDIARHNSRTLAREMAAKRKAKMMEPRIHSHITDSLDPDHPLANDNVVCAVCGVMVHHCINECMQTWVEAGTGEYCIKCFAALTDAEALDDARGLKG